MMQFLSLFLHFAFALFVLSSSAPPFNSPLRPLSTAPAPATTTAITNVQTQKNATIPASSSSSRYGFLRSVTKKGIGVSFVKSLTSWKQFGVGLKVPISAHFPGLEKKKFMPKVTSFFGVQYPQGIKQPHVYRVALTTSYSMDPILSGIWYNIKKKKIIIRMQLDPLYVLI